MSEIFTSWRGLPAEQQPAWPDPSDVDEVRRRLATLPPLTSASAVRSLLHDLTFVQAGKAFILQAGDCAEPFGAEAVINAARKYRVITCMADILARALGVPVVKIGRLAGQFAKPRSHAHEIINGKKIYSFRGLIVNGPEAAEADRRPDPRRMLSAYDTARLVLDEIARLVPDGYPAGDGAPPHPADGPLWASHEALLLDYEEPLARCDPADGRSYLLSTHLPWIGERTRQADGAHVAFLASMANSVACKIGPDATCGEVIRLCETLDRHRVPGRLTLISRMGAPLVRDRLPPLVRAVKRAGGSGYPVIWMCDPMHGNQIRTASGMKTRRVADVVAELSGFVDVMRDCGEWPGGVHLEIAGEEVTECLWDSDPATDKHLHRAYRSLCDGRLSDVQAIYVAEQLAGFLGGDAGPGSDGSAVELMTVPAGPGPGPGRRPGLAVPVVCDPLASPEADIVSQRRWRG